MANEGLFLTGGTASAAFLERGDYDESSEPSNFLNSKYPASTFLRNSLGIRTRLAQRWLSPPDAQKAYLTAVSSLAIHPIKLVRSPAFVPPPIAPHTRARPILTPCQNAASCSSTRFGFSRSIFPRLASNSSLRIAHGGDGCRSSFKSELTNCGVVGGAGARAARTRWSESRLASREVERRAWRGSASAYSDGAAYAPVVSGTGDRCRGGERRAFYFCAHPGLVV